MDTIKFFSLQGIFVKWLPLISIVFFSFGEIFRGQIYLITSFLLILPFAIYYVLKYKVNNSLLSFIIFIFLGSILNLVVTYNGIGGTIVFLTNVFLALFCILNIRYAKYLALVVLCYNLLFLYARIFIDMVDPNYLYEHIGLSRNHPGMLLVVWSCFWGFSKYITEKKISIVLPVLSCILAFFLEGRSSLGLLFVLSVISIFIRSRSFLTFVLVSFGVFIFVYWDVIVDLYMGTRFAESALDSSRYQIWNAYFEALTPISLFAGLELNNVPLIHAYGNNPHNFLLNFHYRMGLLGVVALITLIVKSIKKYIKEDNYVLLLYLACIITRFMFDACINSTYDFILYTMLLYPILRKQLPVSQSSVSVNNSKFSIINNIWSLF